MTATGRALWAYLTLNAALLMLAAAGLHGGGLWWLTTGGCVALIGWRVGRFTARYQLEPRPVVVYIVVVDTAPECNSAGNRHTIVS